MHRLETNQTDVRRSETNHSVEIAAQNISDQQKLLAYWQEKLANPNRLHLIASDNERTLNPSQIITFDIDEADINKISLYTSDINVSPKHFFLSVLYTLLLQYNQDDDMIIGTTEESDDTNSNESLPLRIKNQRKETFLKLMQNIAKCEEEAVAHKLPCIEIFKSIDIAKRAVFNYATPFQVLLDTKQLTVKTDTKVSPFEYFGININGTQGIIQYNTEILNERFVTNLLRHFNFLMQYAISHIDETIDTYPAVTPYELELINKYNATEYHPPLNSFVEKVEAIASATPALPMVTFHAKNYLKKNYSYGEINAKANQLARYLISLNLPTNTYIGICLERSEKLLIVFLAIAKAGLSFVPLDNEQNNALSFKLKDPKISCILTDNTHQDFFTNETKNIVNLEDSRIAQHVNTLPKENLNATPSQIAYKIYTSGTTGNPKGVVISTTGLNNLYSGLTNQAFPNHSQIICTASHCFDACYFDWMLAFAKEGTIHLTPETHRQNMPFLNKIIADNKINVGVFVPEQLEKIKINSPLEYIISMGAQADKNVLNKLLRTKTSTGKMRVTYNGYGPTENTIASMLNVYRLNTDVSLIGRPLSNIQSYCVNSTTMQVMPLYAEGEIWEVGDSVALGYDGLEQQTKDRFCNLHFNSKKGIFEETPNDDTKPVRVYKTGDYGCFTGDNIKFLGRKDRQIKLKGARLELDTIQDYIKSHPLVKNAYIMPNENNTALIAFIVLKDEFSKDTSEQELKVELIKYLNVSTTLPMIACPRQIIKITEMPINTNGKINTKALKELAATSNQAVTSDVLAANYHVYTELEEVLLPIWLNVLHMTRMQFDKKDPYSSFIELGGCSLEFTAFRNAIIENRSKLKIDPKFTNEEIRHLIQPFLSLSLLAETLATKVLKNTEEKFFEISSQHNFNMFSNGTEQQKPDKMQPKTAKNTCSP